MQLLVVVDGTDVFRETVKLPVTSSTIMADQNQYFVAGGAISAHTKKRHLSLVNAEKTKLDWKLGSLSILNGVCWHFVENYVCAMSCIIFLSRINYK